MKYLISRLFRIRHLNSNLEGKVDFLRKAGLNVSVMNKEDKYRNGYTLGKMKDSRLVSSL